MEDQNPFVLTAVVVIIIGVITINWYTTLHIKRQWQKFATKENLAFTASHWWARFTFSTYSPYAVAGVYRQRLLTIRSMRIVDEPVYSIWGIPVGHRNRRTHSGIQGSIGLYNLAKLSLSIKRRGWAWVLKQWTAPATLSASQRELNTRFVVEGYPAVVITEILQAQPVQNALLAPRWLDLRWLNVNGQTLNFSFNYHPSTAQELSWLLDQIFLLAVALENAAVQQNTLKKRSCTTPSPIFPASKSATGPIWKLPPVAL